MLARALVAYGYFGMRRTGIWLAVLGTLVGIGTVIALWLIIAYLHRG